MFEVRKQQQLVPEAILVAIDAGIAGIVDELARPAAPRRLSAMAVAARQRLRRNLAQVLQTQATTSPRQPSLTRTPKPRG